MKEFRAKAIINAPAAVVFQTLTNLDIYPDFDPNCIKIEGRVLVNSCIKIRSKLSPDRLFKVTITELKPNEKMVWEAGLPFNLFKGVRTFTVIAKDDQTTEFEMVEVISGLLPHVKMLPDMSAAFSDFAKGLKRFIEARK
ncbi:MAG TPA: SRPBCC domain-containing protein [Myxococcota bacterium]|nr:SRPBCC domain-containing protein [Myxococcota bacterium]